MKKNKNFQFYDNMHTSEELKQKVLNQTIYKEKEKGNIKKIPKLAYTLGVIVLISFISCVGVIAAEYINKMVINKTYDEKERTYHQTFSTDGTVEINDVSNLNCKGKNLKKIGDTLGLQFIYVHSQNNIVNNCDIKRNEKYKIESIHMYINDYKDFSEENSKIKNYDSNPDNISDYMNGKHIGLGIDFMTQNASDETKNEFQALYEAQTGKELAVKEIRLEKLNVIAYAYEPLRPGTGRWSTFVTFEYHNIVYNFEGYRISLEYLIDFVQNLNI